jgi:formylglycine-generating enzyme required for sulfatase activity
MRRLTLSLAPSAAVLFVVFAASAEPPSSGSHEGAAPPGRESACPDDMRLVDHPHYDVIDRICTDRRDGKHCFAYQPGSNKPRGEPEHLRFCMDAFEAPNKKGAKPLVMQSSVDGSEWCGARGKRLCREVEFESACEGPDLLPWSYGWSADGEACNSGKPWRPFHAEVLYEKNDEAARELERLWQGEPAGSRARCATKEGVFDLVGNVEEWVTSRQGRKWPVTLIGGFWSKPWTGCRGANDAHEPTFRFYETGFRCCKDL